MEPTTRYPRKHVVVSPTTHRILKMACAIEGMAVGTVANSVLNNWAEGVLRKHGIEKPR